MFSFQHTSFSEPEEGMIPDSPMQTVNKMKLKKKQICDRYFEKLLLQPLPG